MADEVKKEFGFGWRKPLARIVERVINSTPSKLLQVHKTLYDNEFKVHKLRDEIPEGNSIELTDIDPFTFLVSTLCRNVTHANRILILHALEDLWNLPQSKEYPKEDDPFPRMECRANIFFFPFKYHRDPDTIHNLWQLAKSCYASPPDELESHDEVKQLFAKCLSIHYVGVSKLTMGLFWLRPEWHLALDANTSRFLRARDITGKVRKHIKESEDPWKEYLALRKAATSTLGMAPYEICRHAYAYTPDPVPPEPDTVPKIERYEIGNTSKSLKVTEGVKRTYEFGWRNPLERVVEKVIKSNSRELLQILETLRQDKLKVHEPKDEDPKGHRIELEEIDPFSFLGSTVCREVSYENRIRIFHALEEHWKIPLSKEFPKEEDAFPMLPCHAPIYFFPFKHQRKDDAITKLWKLAKACYASPPDKLESQDEIAALFAECLAVPYVRAGKLTMGLFWIRPEWHLALDKNTNRFLGNRNIAQNPRGAIYESKKPWKEYLALRKEATRKLKMKPYEICRHAFEHRQLPPLPNVGHEAIRLLEEASPQIVLQGSPGTGKTYLAKEIAKHMTKEGAPGECWSIVQFHPSYNYEDFVRGIRMRTEDKQIVYETINRTLGEMAKKAAENPESTYVLIIDEINRANISAVLGELIYALEYRDDVVITPFKVDGSAELTLPKNLCIIGTMNTADKTIGHMDYAVRRRFAFVTLLPDAKLIKDPEAKRWFKVIDQLMSNKNYRSEDYDYEDVAIGHSYFMKPEQLQDNLQYQVIPILKEYVRDGVIVSDEAAKKISEWESNVRGGELPSETDSESND